MTQAMASSLGLDLSPGALLAGFVFSVVGVYAFKMGRKTQNTGVIWTGVALMVYPLFLNGALKLWIAGLALSALGWFFWTRHAE